MGWGSGSLLMDKVIRKLKAEHVPEYTRKLIYETMIPAMQDMDWDTEIDCMGIDPVYDNLLRESFPDWFKDDQNGD